MSAFLASAITIGMVFLFGCVGEIITEKAGHLNLGIPGIMCIGTAGGCFGVSIYINSTPVGQVSLILLLLSAVLLSCLFSAIAGLIYAFLTVTLRANQNVTGLALTIFGSGFTQFFMESAVDKSRFAEASKVMSLHLPFADNLGWFGEIFLSHGALVYLAIAIAVITAIILKRTRLGLNLRAIGENPATADAVGINVTAYKYGAILIGSAIAGLGGLFYIMNFVGGSWENASTIEALGWLSIALVIFTLWKPDLSILGSIVFGALYIVNTKIAGINFSQMILLKLLPYLITVIVLIVTSIIGKKETQPPASLGINYFREDR